MSPTKISGKRNIGIEVTRGLHRAPSVTRWKMDILDTLKNMAELDSGIIPKSVWVSGGKINEGRWGSMSENEIRKSRRKFRKLWRQACKELNVDTSRTYSPRLRLKLVDIYLKKKVKKSLQARAK